MRKLLMIFLSAFLLLAGLSALLFLMSGCSDDEHEVRDSRVTVTVYDDKGNVIPNVRVKMYDEKQYEAFKRNNRTEPTAAVETDAHGRAVFHLIYQEWFDKEKQRFLMFVVQYGAGESNYQIWSSGSTMDAGKDAQVTLQLRHLSPSLK